MNWEAIGAVGEALGALGVITTLGYLAVQIRQNTKSVRRTAHISTTDAFNQLSSLVVQDPEVARISRIGALDPGKLNEEERYRFERLTGMLINNFENLFFQHRDGLLETERWESYEETLRGLVSSPGFSIVYWQHVRLRHRLGKSFRTYVEGLREGQVAETK